MPSAVTVIGIVVGTVTLKVVASAVMVTGVSIVSAANAGGAQ